MPLRSVALADSPHRVPPLAASAAAGCCSAVGGAHQPANGSAGKLQELWVRARAQWSVEDRTALLELLLLSACYNSVAQAATALVDVAREEDDPDTATRIQAVASSFFDLFADDVQTLHSAWDLATVCPFGLAAPPLSSVRPDLPLQRGFRRLTANARLVLLTYAPRAGHTPVLIDATALARRSGLAVSDVHLALHALHAGHWMERRADIAAGVASASPALFLSLSAGPWAERTRRG
jgi:hypothetical protein